MRKFLCAVLSLAVCFSLSACKSNPETEQTSSLESVITVAETVSSEAEAVPEPEPEPVPNFTVKLSFAGDMILACQQDNTTAGSFNEYANKYPSCYFLEKVKHIFEDDDFTIANLENVLTDRPLTEIYKDYSPAFWFKSKAANIDILSSASVEGVTLNNNHINDYSTEGVSDTIAAVTNSGIDYGTAEKIMYFEKNGFKIAVVCVGLWSTWSVTPALAKLEEAKTQSDYQVMLFHGGTEKLHSPEDWKINAAHTFVDNGADLVVGGHPHVLQPREIYNGVEIVYSIGNFCYGGARRPENRTVIYQMELTVGENNQLKASRSNIIPCYVYTGSVNNYQPAVVEEANVKQKILDFMDGKCDSPV